VGALSALGFAERAPTGLALLGTLPRKREMEEKSHRGGISGFAGMTRAMFFKSFR
jgi:hypothetical protein